LGTLRLGVDFESFNWCEAEGSNCLCMSGNEFASGSNSDSCPPLINNYGLRFSDETKIWLRITSSATNNFTSYSVSSLACAGIDGEIGTKAYSLNSNNTIGLEAIPVRTSFSNGGYGGCL